MKSQETACWAGFLRLGAGFRLRIKFVSDPFWRMAHSAAKKMLWLRKFPHMEEGNNISSAWGTIFVLKILYLIWFVWIFNDIIRNYGMHSMQIMLMFLYCINCFECGASMTKVDTNGAISINLKLHYLLIQNKTWSLASNSSRIIVKI